MKKTRLLCLAMSLVMVFMLLTGCGGTNNAGTGTQNPDSSQTPASGGDEAVANFKPVTWKIGHIRPEGSRTHETIKWFAEEVNKQTNGLITIEIYPARSLGDYEVVQERISMGDIEMALQGAGQNVDKSLIMPTVPYLYSNWDQAIKYTDMETGIVSKFVEERLAKQDIKLLGQYPMYFACVASAKPIPDYENPEVSRNLKARVPTSKAFDLLGTTFGFIATPLPSSENFTSMQTGIVDAVIGGGAEYYWGELKDVTKYLLPCNTHFETQWLMINSDVWASLPQKFQEIISSLAQQMQEKGFEAARAEEKSYYDKFTGNGSTVYDLTVEQVDAYAKVYREKCWPKLEDDLGEEGVKVLNQIRDDLGLSH